MFYDWYAARMPKYEPVTLGMKFAVRIGDLEDSDGLHITCWKCGHDAVIPAAVLKWRFDANDRILQLEHRLPCGKCRNRDLNHWQTVRPIADTTRG